MPAAMATMSDRPEIAVGVLRDVVSPSPSWPLLFSLAQARPGYEAWLQGIAIPWWLVLGGIVSVHLVARAGKADPQPERRQTECRCGTCVARETRALSS